MHEMCHLVITNSQSHLNITRIYRGTNLIRHELNAARIECERMSKMHRQNFPNEWGRLNIVYSTRRQNDTNATYTARGCVRKVNFNITQSMSHEWATNCASHNKLNAEGARVSHVHTTTAWSRCNRQDTSSTYHVLNESQTSHELTVWGAKVSKTGRLYIPNASSQFNIIHATSRHHITNAMHEARGAGILTS